MGERERAETWVEEGEITEGKWRDWWERESMEVGGRERVER